MKRMPKFITVGIKTYKVKRVKKDLYALYHCNGFFQDEFFGYEDKHGIEDAIYRGTW
jgi:hypothetical protein